MSKYNRAFTLVELVVVAIVVVILMGIAVPSHNKLLRKNRIQKGRLALQAIYEAQKRYRIDNYGYYAAGCTTASSACLSNMNTALDLRLDTKYFTYSINSSGDRTITVRSDSGSMEDITINTGYKANAKYSFGRDKSCTMSITETGGDVEGCEL